MTPAVSPGADRRNVHDPHAGQPIASAGEPLATARVAVIMIHGRGASAESMLTLAPFLRTEGIAFLAPQAAGGTWYPYSFLAPIAENEPGISSGMHVIAHLIEQISATGITAEQIFLLGFSQGACLASEYFARYARRYAGLASLSGGLIGPDGTPRDYSGSLNGTPIFFGCSDVDPHVPATRVRESADVLRGLGGDVTLRLYPGMGHTVSEDEIATVQTMLSAVLR